MSELDPETSYFGVDATHGFELPHSYHQYQPEGAGWLGRWPGGGDESEGSSLVVKVPTALQALQAAGLIALTLQ